MHISHQKDERWSKYDEEAETVKRRLRREGNGEESDEEERDGKIEKIRKEERGRRKSGKKGSVTR